MCSIRVHYRLSNQLRHAVGQPAQPYAGLAETHPTLRDQILTMWTAAHRRALRQWHAYQARPPWLRDPFYGQALCIHSYEGAWHDPGSPGGGLQFLQSTWDNYVVRGYQFAATPGGATAGEQLHAAYRLVQHDGSWREWSTASLCGLG